MIIYSIFLFVGCAPSKATLKTYVDPAIQSASIKSIAVFALRNTSISPGEALDLDRAMTQSFLQKNRNISIIGSSEATKKLNDAGLVEAYSNFLLDFARSGIPNTATLKKIGSELGVDAILQGNLGDVIQRDASYGVTALTSLTFRYTLLSTQSGNILWEGTSSARKEKTPMWSKAPPIYEVIDLAHKKVLDGLPTLGK